MQRSPRAWLPVSAQLVISPLLFYTHNRNIASYTYTPRDLHCHTYMGTHWAFRLNVIYIYTHSTNTATHMLISTIVCLYSYLHTYTNLVRQIKTRKLPLECPRWPLSFWPLLTEIQFGGRAMIPHVKLPSWLWKGLNFVCLVWIYVSRTLEGLWTLWEASRSFGVRS